MAHLSGLGIDLSSSFSFQLHSISIITKHMQLIFKICAFGIIVQEGDYYVNLCDPIWYLVMQTLRQIQGFKESNLRADQ
jgi:hypothetical protein